MDDPPMNVVITTSEVPLDPVGAPSVSIMPCGMERAGMSIQYYPGSGITRVVMDNERVGFSYNSNISRFTGQPEQHYGTYAYLRHMLYAGSVGFAYATWRGPIDWRGLVESALQEIKEDVSVSRDERDMLRWIADRHAHCQRCMHRFVLRGNVGMNTYKSWQRLPEFKLWRAVVLLNEGTRLSNDIILRVYEIASGMKNKPACCLPFTQ